MDSTRTSKRVKKFRATVTIPAGVCSGDQGSCPFYIEMQYDDGSSPCIRLRSNSMSPSRSVACPLGNNEIRVSLVSDAEV